MSRSVNKAAHLADIGVLLLLHPGGLAQSEIARRQGVHRSTIYRDLADLHAPVYEEGRRYFIDREAYLVNVRFTLQEAIAAHLAARLLTTRQDRNNPHAVSALRKLGISIEPLAPQISRHLQCSADVMDSMDRWVDLAYLRVLENVTLAWAERKKAHIWYRQASGDVNEYSLYPFFVEPGAVRFSTCVIGMSFLPGELRTFKIERIERIELTREEYNLPEGFDPGRLPENPWGIWHTGQEPVEIVLRFGPRVASRVRETRWHRSEQVAKEKDGSLLWRAWVAEPQVMLPWIRDWGADVEVIALERVRNEIL